MIQECINQPGNLEANLKSLSLRLPSLSGDNLQSKAVKSNIALYSDFLKSEKEFEDPGIHLLPPDLKQEVLRGIRTLRGAQSAFKQKLKCPSCGQ